MSFDARPLLEYVGHKYWTVAQELHYRGNTDEFTIPAGFHTDLASTPRIVWPVLPPFGAYMPAALVHDQLCRDPAVSLKDADGVFRRVLRETGVPRWQRALLYAGVRVAHLAGMGRRAVGSGREQDRPAKAPSVHAQALGARERVGLTPEAPAPSEDAQGGAA
jgi:hypothetical protein